MKITNYHITFKTKIRFLYLLALSVIISLILALNIAMLYFTSTTLNKLIISSILLTISGVIISIPVYITSNALKNHERDSLKAYNILLDISGTALFMILIYLLFTIYKFLVIMPL